MTTFPGKGYFGRHKILYISWTAQIIPQSTPINCNQKVLRDLLVRAELETTEDNKPNGTSPCNSKRCKTCQHINCTDTFKSHITTQYHRVQTSETCKTSNLSLPHWVQQMQNAVCWGALEPLNTYASMAIGMTLKQWEWRNQWQNIWTSQGTRWMISPLCALRRSGRMMLNWEEDEKAIGSTHWIPWLLQLVSGTQPLNFVFFRSYSIENEGLDNTFTFFVTFPGMLAVTAVHNESVLFCELDQFANNFNGRRKH